MWDWRDGLKVKNTDYNSSSGEIWHLWQNTNAHKIKKNGIDDTTM